MKKIILVVTLLIIFVVGIVVSTKADAKTTDCIRIHIRANSMNDTDQNVKYLVKDRLIDMLSPMLIECDTKQDAYRLIKSQMSVISSVANQVLEENGLTYGVRVMLREEEFPTREYLNYIFIPKSF